MANKIIIGIVIGLVVGLVLGIAISAIMTYQPKLELEQTIKCKYLVRLLLPMVTLLILCIFKT